jgi:hypothetical protein
MQLSAQRGRNFVFDKTAFAFANFSRNGLSSAEMMDLLTTMTGGIRFLFFRDAAVFLLGVGIDQS